jgi:hypothetical protein
MLLKRRLAYTTALCVIALYTSACQTTEPGVEVRLVHVPVPQPCLPADQIPAEPATVSHLLNGAAAHDLAVVAESALLLRAWGQEMHAAIVACAG